MRLLEHSSLRRNVENFFVVGEAIAHHLGFDGLNKQAELLGIDRRHDARSRPRSLRSTCCWVDVSFRLSPLQRLQKPRAGVWTDLGRGPIIEVLLRPSVSVRVLGR